MVTVARFGPLALVLTGDLYYYHLDHNEGEEQKLTDGEDKKEKTHFVCTESVAKS